MDDVDVMDEMDAEAERNDGGAGETDPTTWRVPEIEELPGQRPAHL